MPKILFTLLWTHTQGSQGCQKSGNSHRIHSTRFFPKTIRRLYEAIPWTIWSQGSRSKKSYALEVKSWSSCSSTPKQRRLCVTMLPLSSSVYILFSVLCSVQSLLLTSLITAISWLHSSHCLPPGRRQIPIFEPITNSSDCFTNLEFRIYELIYMLTNIDCDFFFIWQIEKIKTVLDQWEVVFFFWCSIYSKLVKIIGEKIWWIRY